LIEGKEFNLLFSKIFTNETEDLPPPSPPQPPPSPTPSSASYIKNRNHQYYLIIINIIYFIFM
jgi:hypothetical protein